MSPAKFARKLRAVQISGHLQAILGCLLGEDWLLEMMIVQKGYFLGKVAEVKRQR